MALDIQTTLTFSASKVILTDATGAYAVGNPGGYGSPNPAFADYVHYAFITKKNVNSVADSAMVLDSYNPVSATAFQATRDVDGWYEGTKVNILKWSNATSYTGGTIATGSIVYDDGILYFCIGNNSNSKPSLNPLLWTIFTDVSTVLTNPSVIVTYVDRVTVYDADTYWSGQIADLSQQGQCAVPEDDKLKVRLDTIYRNIQQALVADQLGNDSDGEWCVLRLRAMGAKRAA